MMDATGLLRLRTAWRLRQLARQDPVAAQRRELMRLLHRARRTRFGRAHGFAAIGDVAEFQRRVPLRDHAAFWRDWWQPHFPVLRDVSWPGLIPFFALTSGTTGGPTKHVPVSRAMLRSNRRAALDALGFHLAATPGSRVMRGRAFLLGGSTALERLAPGVRAGDLSGIAAATIPRWARGHSFPPEHLALLADWDAKIAALAARAPGAAITSLSGTPSWLLILFEQLAAARPDQPRRLAALLPGLELLIHGGVGFAPYRAAFAPWLDGAGIATREVYPATEGFVAVADVGLEGGGPGEGLRLLVDNGLFFEFVRPDAVDDPRAERRWLADAALDTEYALVLSSNAGLWAYVLGDTVRLLSRDPPRLLVAGRTAATLSAFGEHLSGGELDQAMAKAATAVGAAVTDYAAGALFPDAVRTRGGHVFVVEFAEAMPGRAGPFGLALDQALAQGNDDYAAHRPAMAPPEVRVLAPGGFAAWMRNRNKLGGQNKVPRVINDPALLQGLLRFAEGPGSGR